MQIFFWGGGGMNNYELGVVSSGKNDSINLRKNQINHNEMSDEYKVGYFVCNI